MAPAGRITFETFNKKLYFLSNIVISLKYFTSDDGIHLHIFIANVIEQIVIW